MTHIPRHEEILAILSRLRSVTVAELTDRLNVSEVTIRKDLAALEEMNRLIRTRGGAKLAEDSRLLNVLEVRRNEYLQEKESIAEEARQMVREGDTIYIDSGSTCQVFAQAVAHMNLRVITNSIDIMNTLADATGISLFCLGGSYRKDAGSFLGPLAISALKNFQLETCFMGATGVSKKGWFSSQNTIESDLKQQVIASSSRTIILADSHKYETKAFSVFARPEEVDIFITDGGFPDAAHFRELGIEVITGKTGKERN